MEIPFCASNANFTWLNLNSDDFFQVWRDPKVTWNDSFLDCLITINFHFASRGGQISFFSILFFFLQFLFHEFQITFSCSNFLWFCVFCCMFERKFSWFFKKKLQDFLNSYLKLFERKFLHNFLFNPRWHEGKS